MNNLKKQLIPDNMKKNIDEILEKQLFNANRYYAESNANISQLMENEIRKPSTEFLTELKLRWNWHNHFYEKLLEPAYKEIVKQNINAITPLNIKELIDVYETCVLVDTATLVTSGAIKKHLQYQLDLVSNSNFIEEEKFMLLTPPVNTFFSQYQTEHLMYIYLLKTDFQKASTYKKYLLEKYHANDEIIFQSRFNKKFKSRIDDSVISLLKDIKEYQISDEYKTKHFYFTLERPERKAFRDIIIYDNLDEKNIATSLVGISGFLFRKYILSLLNNANILKNDGFIYEFTDDVIVDGLNRLYLEREQTMVHEIKPYKQRGDTCAIACMLMILEYLNIIPKADWKLERKYYRIYQSHYMVGTPISAIAWHFAKNGLDTEVIHSENQIFTNKNSMLPEDLYEETLKEYMTFLNKAQDKGAIIINGKDINCDILRKKLEEDKLIILAGQMGNSLHAILLCGYDNDKFIVCDPLYKQKQIRTKEEIEMFINTKIGKWCVTVTSKKLNKDLLMNNLSTYKEEAAEKLNTQLDKDVLAKKLDK